MMAMAERMLTARELTPARNHAVNDSDHENSTEIMAVRCWQGSFDVAALRHQLRHRTTKVPATMEAKAATTKMSVRYAKMQNRPLPCHRCSGR